MSRYTVERVNVAWGDLQRGLDEIPKDKKLKEIVPILDRDGTRWYYLILVRFDEMP